MKNVLILGAGISGLGAAHMLLERGCHVVISDLHGTKEQAERQVLEKSGAEFRIGPQDPSLLEGVDTVVVSPVIPRENPVVSAAMEKGIPVLSEVELAWIAAKAPILAVTGTNGKTTTTTLLGHMIEDGGIPFTVAGNVGVSLSEEVEKVPVHGLIAAELSSFQLEFIRDFRPKAAVILNITPDHMERHHTMAAYAAAKARIFENMGPEDSLLLNAEDPYTAGFQKSAKARVYLMSAERSLPEGACLDGDRLVLRLHGKEIFLCREGELHLKGHHNVENCLAAAFLAYEGGVPVEAIRQALVTYRAIEHRLEYVKTICGVDYYNDSKATNVDAAVKALEAFKTPVILIAGGHDKLTPIDAFMAFVKDHVKRLVLLGAAAPRFRQAAEKAGISPVVMADSMEDAVGKAAALAGKGDTVLLSPACSSYDMYHSYEERGQDFKRIVNQLK